MNTFLDKLIGKIKLKGRLKIFQTTFLLCLVIKKQLIAFQKTIKIMAYKPIYSCRIISCLEP